MAKKLPLDKVKHFMAGVFITLVVGYLASLWLTPVEATLTGVAAAVLIGALKEAAWDNLLKKGTDDKYDAIATALGGAFGALVVWGFLIYD